MGVTRQPVVQPCLRVHHRQGRRGVGHPHQELQRMAEHHGAVRIALVKCYFWFKIGNQIFISDLARNILAVVVR